MNAARRRTLLNLVASRAIAGAEELPPVERATLYEAVALILPKEEAERAEFAAFSIRNAEAAQLELHQIVNGL